MKKNVLQLLALLGTQCLLAQTTNYELKTIAEGNFGTPNGDVFSVTVTPTSTTQSTGLYQAANSTTGFDVLQDFQIAGNKAILLSKSSNYRIVIANYPSFTHVATFTNQGAPQTLAKASNTKAYVAVNSNALRQINLVNNTISPVSDPGNQLSGNCDYMVAAKGFIYAAVNSKIVKIDTITAAVTGTINPGLGSILGLEYDAVNDHVWILGKTGGVSSAVKMEVANNDLLNAPIVFTGVTNAGYLRYANNKLYFLSGKNVHAYNILVPNLPTTAVYTSSLSGSWDFAYGKAFYVEPSTGNMAFGSANAFTGPSLYEIVNGTSMAVVASGSVTGCIGVNELILRTYTVSSSPVPTVANLPVASGQCSVTLTAPTANGQSGVVTGTTSAATTYTAQGTYTLSWTYSDAGGTSSQTQTVVVLDNIAPVPNVANLPTMTVSTCSITLTRPTATDNCSGTITATTTAPLTYTAQGTYTINWVYIDAKGNTASQSQTVVVNCPSTGLDEASALQASIYPNPVSDVLTVSIPGSNSEYAITVSDQLGKVVLQTSMTGETALDVKALSAGLYYMNITHKASGKNTVQKIVVSH